MIHEGHNIKGIVHPKIKIHHPHPWVVPNLYKYICSAEHKGLQTFFKISSLVQQNKYIYTGLDQLKSEYDDSIFIFGWTTPLRNVKKLIFCFVLFSAGEPDEGKVTMIHFHLFAIVWNCTDIYIFLLLFYFELDEEQPVKKNRSNVILPAAPCCEYIKISMKLSAF